jgi:hypothetical protein
MSTVQTVHLPEPPFDAMNALRYAGCVEAEAMALDLLYDCRRELSREWRYAVCFCELPLTVTGDCCDFGCFSLRSADLAAYFGDCRRAVLFAATVGVGPDRLVKRYSQISPSRAVMMQALGAERIEALCDAFCETQYGALPSRFSPGYGDLPLDVQRQIVRVLDTERKIGVCLNESLLMSPTKSVTAFVGIQGE